MKQGFTLIEAIIVMAILAILVGVSSSSLVSFGKKTNQGSGQAVVLDALSQARSNAMANLGATTWGLHLQTDKVIIFNGATFVPEDAQNQTKLLPNNVSLSWSLGGGGADIIFNQNQSTTPNFGNVSLNNSSDNQTTVMNINSEGMIE